MISGANYSLSIMDRKESNLNVISTNPDICEESKKFSCVICDKTYLN